MTALGQGPLFPDVRFTRVLSLGGPAEPPDDWRTVFDRMLAPIEAVAAILADDGARLGTRFVASEAGEAVRCAAYGVLYTDAFRRDGEGGVAFAAEDVERCRASLGEAMAGFLRACDGAGGPVLFLRSGPAADLTGGRPHGGPARPGAAADALAAAIARRFPALDFRLLIAAPASDTDAAADHPVDPRVARALLPPGGGTWSALSERLAFSDAAEASASEEGAGPARSAAATRPDDGSAPPDQAWKAGLELWRGGRSASAVEAFAGVYARGYRDPAFLRDYLGLLTGETRYREVIALAAALRREGSAEHPRAARHLAMLVGHAKLALAHPREPEIALAAARAASPAWLDAPALIRTLADAIAARRPFAFIRLGDGEARFLLGGAAGEASGLTVEEAHAMGGVVWENWFGEPWSAVDPDRLAGLRAAYADAVRAADVLGVCGPDRLRADTGHHGYLAWQEAWLRETLAGTAPPHFADAQVHRQLDAEMPLLEALLEGQDVLGVISPHPALADTLGRRLRIGRVAGHVVPAEGRLPNAAETRDALGRHFPEVSDRLLAGLSVPRPGCVFLVAAGLLGKIYCARIKALGGIAIDIGALADAWMGFDTRDGQLAGAARLPSRSSEGHDPARAVTRLSDHDAGSAAPTEALLEATPRADAVREDRSAPVEPAEAPPRERRATYGCVSIGKTGSMALTAAMREAGFPDAVHLHFLGPQALALKRANPEPMYERASEVAGRIDDPGCDFRLVACVRDPIARILSWAFHVAEDRRRKTGIDIVRDREALIAWWEADRAAQCDLWTLWFDDTFGATFGFDFREHPFDHARRSIRYESDRLRLLVLRKEDERARREVELGWLLDRDRVALRTVNDAANQGYAAAYKSFLESFAAPSSWLDTLYESELIRHVYTAEERAAFKARWGGGRTRTVPPAGAVPEGRSAPADPAAAGRTVLCLSMMKTGSTAVADALREAAAGEAVAHLHHLGPLARSVLPTGGRPVEEVAARLDDPEHRFKVVSCVRDPIARWISEVFHDAALSDDPAAAAVIADHDAFIARVDSKKMPDYSALWFDDSLKAPFGFDFREHPFDHGRGSLRHSSGRVDLLVLRQEDPAAVREAELGWLLGRGPVRLHRRNARSAGALAERYRAFVESFVAPTRWLDLFYETEVVRHFYTQEERDMFRRHWHPVTAPPDAGMATAPEPEAPAAHAGPGPVDPPAEAGGPPTGDGSAGTPPPAAAPPPASETAAQDLERVSAELETLRRRLREGHAVDFNDYAYRPRERDWSRSAGAARLREIFDAGAGAYAGLLERFCAFDDRFRAIPVLPDAGGPHWENWWLPGLDAVALYGLVATRAPGTYLEIGSGHSTRFVRRAIREHGLATRVVSVDPHPTEDVSTLCDEVVRTRCEDAPASLFASLGAGDMLFFDGSHRSFQNSDATVFFTEILPSLAPGVVYGIHDVFLPFDYPESWTDRFYNEQYPLMTYLLGGAGGDEILFPAHHVWREPAYAPLRNRLFLGTRHLDWLTSSFWMRRAGG